MNAFVRKYVNACLNCLYYKRTGGQKQGKLHSIEKTPIPFHTLHVDHVGPFERSRKGNRYLLVIVDGFTKFTMIEPVKDTKAKRAAKILLDVVHLFGVPHRVITDRGTAFTAQSFKIFCSTYGIRHVLNAVATPRANGQCERYNRTIVASLAAMTAGNEPERWDEKVKQIQGALNTTYNKGIGTTPMEALMGYKARCSADAWILQEIQDEVERIDLRRIRGQIAAHITEDQRKQKEQYDKGRREAKQYREGDVVMVEITTERATGDSRKLHAKYKGPFRVSIVLGNDRYEVEDLREGGRRAKTVVAVERLKPWVAMVE